MIEPFTVKMYDDESGGVKIYIKKEYAEILKKYLFFPIKKELKAVIDQENERLCIQRL